jgi:hypothetical protein
MCTKTLDHDFHLKTTHSTLPHSKFKTEWLINVKFIADEDGS